MSALQTLLAAIAAASLIVAGIVILAGPAWGMIAAGVLLAVVTVLLYDPKRSARK